MTQENGKETLEDFVKRSQDDALTRIGEINRHIDSALKGGGDSGLTIADMGSKISTEEVKLEILRSVAFLIQA